MQAIKKFDYLFIFLVFFKIYLKYFSLYKTK
jgi:hypothetical protein